MCRCRWQSDLSLECFGGVLPDKLMINYSKTEFLLPSTGASSLTHLFTHNATFHHAQYKPAKKNAGQGKMFLSDAVSIASHSCVILLLRLLITLKKIILKISQLQPTIATLYKGWLHERPERSKDFWLWTYTNRIHTFYFTRFTRIGCCGLCRDDYKSLHYSRKKKHWKKEDDHESLINTRKMTTRSSRMQALFFVLY